MNLDVNLIFLIKLIFLHDQKVMTKNLNILRTKGVFKTKLKAFSSFLKGFE